MSGQSEATLTKKSGTSGAAKNLHGDWRLSLRRREALAFAISSLLAFSACKSKKKRLLSDEERKSLALEQKPFSPKLTPLSINTTDLDSAIELGLRALENNLNEEEAHAPFFEIYGHSFKTTRILTGQYVDPERTEPPGRHHNWTLSSNVAGKGLYALVIGHQALGRDPNQSERILGLATYVRRMMYRQKRGTSGGKAQWEVIGIPGDRIAIDSDEVSLYYVSTAGAGYRGVLALNLLAKDPRRIDAEFHQSSRDLMDNCVNNLLTYYVYDEQGKVVHDWERFRKEFQIEGGPSSMEIEATWDGAYRNSIQPLMLDALIEYSERFPGGRTEEFIRDIKSYGINDMYPAEWENKRKHGHMYEVVAGINAFSRLAVRDGDRELLARMKAYFDGLFVMGAALPSGWVAERLYGVQRQLGRPKELLHSDTGEINCSVQLIETAIRFGDQDLGAGYYQYAERALRAHVLPAQLRDVDQLVASPDGSEQTRAEYANQIQGAFGFPAPYGVIPMRNAYFVTAYFLDITAGAVASLARIRLRAHQLREGSLFIPLLLDLKTQFATVKSPYTGDETMMITPHKPFEKIYVRRPPWLSKNDFGFVTEGAAASRAAGMSHAFEITDHWIVISTNGSLNPVSFSFRLAPELTHETLNERQLTIEWRGDSVATMSGIEAPLRFFPSK